MLGKGFILRNRGGDIMKGFIDRFEGDFAIVEDKNREMHNIEITKLPQGIMEGDFVFEENGVFLVDEAESKSRKKKIDELMDDLFE